MGMKPRRKRINPDDMTAEELMLYYARDGWVPGIMVEPSMFCNDDVEANLWRYRYLLLAESLGHDVSDELDSFETEFPTPPTDLAFEDLNLGAGFVTGAGETLERHMDRGVARLEKAKERGVDPSYVEEVRAALIDWGDKRGLAAFEEIFPRDD